MIWLLRLGMFLVGLLLGFFTLVLLRRLNACVMGHKMQIISSIKVSGLFELKSTTVLQRCTGCGKLETFSLNGHWDLPDVLAKFGEIQQLNRMME